MRPAPMIPTRRAGVAEVLQSTGVMALNQRKGEAMSTLRREAARRRVDAAIAAQERPWSASPIIVQRRRGARVLITDGDDRVALAVARSLVEAGYEVHTTAAHYLSLTGVSRG